MHCTSVHSSSLILMTESCMRLGCHKQIFTTKCRNQDKLYLILGFWSFTYVKSQNQRGWGVFVTFIWELRGIALRANFFLTGFFLGHELSLETSWLGSKKGSVECPPPCFLSAMFVGARVCRWWLSLCHNTRPTNVGNKCKKPLWTDEHFISLLYQKRSL